MHLSSGDVALILFFVAGWWISGALALVNPLLISFLRVSASFKTVNFGCWACYVVPGIILLLGLYDKIRPTRIPSTVWIVYAAAIPFVTVFHFAFLLWTRRKIRARNAQTKNENAAQPGATPNGGPAMPAGNSAVTVGPPSVS